MYEAEQREMEIRQREDARRRGEEERKRIEINRQAADQKREEDRLIKMKQASPETLRDLREPIRDRFELDIKIWGLRGARRPNRPIV